MCIIFATTTYIFPVPRRYRAELPPDHLVGIEGEWIRVTPCLPCPPWPHSSTSPSRSTSPPHSLNPVDLYEVRRHGHHDRPRPHSHCSPCRLGACRGAPNSSATSSAPTRSSPAPPHRRHCRLPQPSATVTLTFDPCRPEVPCLPLGCH